MQISSHYFHNLFTIVNKGGKILASLSFTTGYVIKSIFINAIKMDYKNDVKRYFRRKT